MSPRPSALVPLPVSPREWRSGFHVGGSVAASAPVVALGLVAIAQATTESGIFDDIAETVGSTVILGLMGLAWVVIGLSIRAAESAPDVAALSVTERSPQ